jgi:hypothetical protein
MEGGKELGRNHYAPSYSRHCDDLQARPPRDQHRTCKFGFPVRAEEEIDARIDNALLVQPRFNAMVQQIPAERDGRYKE